MHLLLNMNKCVMTIQMCKYVRARTQYTHQWYNLYAIDFAQIAFGQVRLVMIYSDMYRDDFWALQNSSNVALEWLWFRESKQNDNNQSIFENGLNVQITI